MAAMLLQLGACTVIGETPEDTTPDDVVASTEVGEDAVVQADTGPDSAAPDVSDHDTSTTDTVPADLSEPPDTAVADAAVEDDTAAPDTSEPVDTVIDEVSIDTVEPPADTTPEVSGPCANPLGITPATLFVEPLQFHVFRGVGGSGDYRFELGLNESGAAIHPLFGTFVAGSTPGRVVVRVTDIACGGKEEAEVTVTAPLELFPRVADIEPARGQLQFVVQGGSSQVQYSLETLGSTVVPASELSATGLLIAGARTETLVVHVVDLGTGSERTATVNVREGGRLQVEPGHLTLPLGETWKLRLAGGSRRVDVRLVNGGAVGPDGQPTAESVIAYEDGIIDALRPGSALLRIEDLHTREILSFSIDVVSSPTLPMHPAGDAKIQGAALVADLDGDGLPEAIVGVPESDIGGYDAGAVLIHRGIEGGFELEPARVLAASGRLDEAGNALAAGDVDGDGLIDLVIGSQLSDEMGTDRGTVRVYRGHPTELVDSEAIAFFFGDTVSDNLGGSVALCDFNGDGRLDLAIGARLAEDENQAPVITNTGAVQLYLGYSVGFQRSPDQVLWGRVPETTGGSRSQASLALGRAMAVGDVDGDGLCDLAVSAVGYQVDSTRTNDGAVFVHRGRGPDAFGPGGLISEPSLALLGNGAEPSGQLGTSVAMGDIDGDGLADLAAGQPEIARRITATTTRASNGAVVVVPGRDIPTTGTLIISSDAAPFRYFGRDNVAETGDRIGWALAIDDADGVAPLDLFIGARMDEQAPYCTSGCGTVHVVLGVQNALPSPLQPNRVYSGDLADQNFGSIFAVAPDLDGDGFADLIGRAGTDNRMAPRAGINVVRVSTPETPLTILSNPLFSAGSRFGAALAPLPDLDGDGWPELAVSAWRAQHDPTPTAQHRAGDVAIYRGTAQGVAATPFQRINSYTTYSASDAVGHALMAVPDVNGDGRIELAVVARVDDTGTACSPARSDAGAIHLFSATANGLFETTPMATIWGPQASQQIHAVAALDINGDTYADVIAGGPAWDRPNIGSSDNTGGLAIYLGGPSIGIGGTTVRCTADTILFGAAQADAFATTLEPLGDLNADGCDELAIGAITGDTTGNNNAGVVHVLFGFGGECAFSTPHRVALSPANTNAQAGGALAAADINGDGLRELAIGGRRWVLGAEALGAVWMVDGAYLRDLAASAAPWVDGSMPSPIRNVVRTGQAVARLTGQRRDEDFGAALALLPGTGFENAWLVVGRPLSDLPGVDGAGAVTVHEVRLADGIFTFGAVPPVAVGGETRRIRSEFGRNLVGWRTRAGRVLAVGANLSSAFATDDGAVFVTRPR